MNLDDVTLFQKLDTQNMLAISTVSHSSFQTPGIWGVHYTFPKWPGPKNILIAGMGGSAIGADLLAAYAAPYCQIPVTVHRDYDLPAWAHDDETLVIASSHSGNTEETLAAFQQARARGCTGTGDLNRRKTRPNGAGRWRTVLDI